MSEEHKSVSEQKVICQICKSSFPPLWDHVDDCTQASGCAACIAKIADCYFDADDQKENAVKPTLWMQGGYGSCFDSCGSSVYQSWVVKPEFSNTGEFHIGLDPVCDNCIKKWIAEKKLTRLDSAPSCSGCGKEYKSYDEYHNRVVISLQRNSEQFGKFVSSSYALTVVVMGMFAGDVCRDRIPDDMAIYHVDWTIYRIDEADVKLYKSQIEKKETEAVNQGDHKLWICRPCFELKESYDVIETACAMCQKLYKNSGVDKTTADHCCLSINLNYVSHICGETKWTNSYQIRFADHITLGEARKYCQKDPVCDDCIESLLKNGILVDMS